MSTIEDKAAAAAAQKQAATESVIAITARMNALGAIVGEANNRIMDLSAELAVTQARLHQAGQRAESLEADLAAARREVERLRREAATPSPAPSDPDAD